MLASFAYEFITYTTQHKNREKIWLCFLCIFKVIFTQTRPDTLRNCLTREKCLSEWHSRMAAAHLVLFTGHIKLSDNVRQAGDDDLHMGGGRMTNVCYDKVEIYCCAIGSIGKRAGDV